MEGLFKHASVYVAENGAFETRDMAVVSGILDCAGDTIFSTPVYDASTCVILPGFVDVHVHLREPGFSYKETITSGTKAAARGGYTVVCAMPNLNPVPDEMSTLQPQLDLIRQGALVRVIPYGAITRGEHGKELADMEAMAPYVVGFSDDGRGVQSDEMMCAAMRKAKELGKLIVAHCEDNSLLRGGYIHDGAYAAAHGHRGICSESEWRQIQRDIELVRRTGCGYHVCHISTKESVELIRQAKREGLDVTCETGPHYLLMDDSMLQEDGRFKMNPPLRDRADREALLAGICDGTIDMIATDHAPHSADEKGRGLEKSAMGIVGLETAFPLLYTYLVKPGVITMEKLMELMYVNPCRRFGIENSMKHGNFTVFDLEKTYKIDPAEFLSAGKATPFTGWDVSGRCLLTVSQGKVVWDSGELQPV
ncbi:MAG: dihydroorotase [Ruminococcaceae bacterium]|nr:dihydroorotase [Oscillospiraceae bacterium]